MIQSLKDVTQRSVDAYTTTPREKWVLSWPGQVSPASSGLVLVSLVSTTLPKHLLPGVHGMGAFLKVGPMVPPLVGGLPRHDL